MKNILLFFLSDIHVDDKTQEFRRSPYIGRSGKEFTCIQTNESAIDDLMDCLDNKLDALFFFSTKKTKEPLEVALKDQTGDYERVTKTHLEWFKERIITKHPELQNAFHWVDYDETKNTEESIHQVTEMAKAIKEYLDNSKDKEIRLYVDMTGGFRHASMMMLSVMQLLGQYEGITIDTVLYSNWNKVEKKDNKQAEDNGAALPEKGGWEEKSHGVVEDVTELHRMFTLVSGIDEFVNFGSVKEIEEYFKKREKSPALEALINTMRDFSDAIKICDTNKIETIVRQLQRSINAFSAEPDKSVHENIFAQIITVLQEEYGKLLSEYVTKIDIIEWCIDKGFLQQAMTLCTEWIPFMLVNKRIAYTDNNNVRLKCKMQGEKLQREWEQTFIISYISKGTHSDASENKGFRIAIDRFLKGTDADLCADLFPEGKEKLLLLFNECKNNPDIFYRIRKGNGIKKKLDEEVPMISEACYALWQLRVEQKHTQDGLEGFIKYKIKDSCDLLNQIKSSLSKEKLQLLLKIDTESSNPDNDETKKKPTWESSEIRYKDMLKVGDMKTKYPEDVMEMLKGFYEIKSKRNQINHAASDLDTIVTIEETRNALKTLMSEYLGKLKKFK